MRTIICLCLALSALSAKAQPIDNELSGDILTDATWERVNDSIGRALEWLIRNQNPDGFFQTQPHGQPGVTGLCIMAFLAQGHLPGEGQYGDQLQSALDYIISC